MFISSLTLTAVVLACVSFFVVRASTTTPTNGTASPHPHPHPSSAKKHPPSAASGLKIKNFIATDALYDGEQEKRIHYNGVTAKETSVSAGPMDGNMRIVLKVLPFLDGLVCCLLLLVVCSNAVLQDIKVCNAARLAPMQLVVHACLNSFALPVLYAETLNTI
uniref:Uncharacterized protein n=1 Tax=Timema tahoe TaxID=61484 RepID=A0A7R9NX51_9NEOP|nr:unnamed protein product [Timema tahoe]